MAETLGVVASAIQVANFGVQLSSSLYSYIETVSKADRRVSDIASKVELRGEAHIKTCFTSLQLHTTHQMNIFLIENCFRLTTKVSSQSSSTVASSNHQFQVHSLPSLPSTRCCIPTRPDLSR